MSSALGLFAQRLKMQGRSVVETGTGTIHRRLARQ